MKYKINLQRLLIIFSFLLCYTCIFYYADFVEKCGEEKSVSGVLGIAQEYGINTSEPIEAGLFGEYWTSSGENGIARIINSNFFSPDTIRPFGDDEYPSPKYPYNVLEQPALPQSYTVLGNQTQAGPILTGLYLTHKNLCLGGRRMKLARPGYYTTFLSPTISYPEGRTAFNASWMLSHDVLDDYFTVQWPLAVRASAGVLNYFFPGWSIEATAEYKDNELTIQGNIKHNKEPEVLKWNDLKNNGTSIAKIYFKDIPDTEIIKIDVSNSDFIITKDKFQFDAIFDAIPETVIISITIGAERYEKAIPVSAEHAV
ncbi:MAG: hypothetical protein AB1765_04380 [Candidatus Hydrogenedentota bacterium]